MKDTHIDIIPQHDGAVRVRMVVKRGDNMAIYSDFFGSQSSAEKWAQDILVAYGGFDRDSHLCDRCGSSIWPWETKHIEDNNSGDGWNDGQFHLSCWHDELTYCSLCEGTNGNHVTVKTETLGLHFDSFKTWSDDHAKGRTTLTYAAWVLAHQEKPDSFLGNFVEAQAKFIEEFNNSEVARQVEKVHRQWEQGIITRSERDAKISTLVTPEGEPF